MKCLLSVYNQKKSWLVYADLLFVQDTDRPGHSHINMLAAKKKGGGEEGMGGGWFERKEVKGITNTGISLLKHPPQNSLINIKPAVCLSAILISPPPCSNTFHWYFLLSMSCLCRFTMPSTTIGSARVLTSPSSSDSLAAILRRIRRMILPDRVHGKPSVNWNWRQHHVQIMSMN